MIDSARIKQLLLFGLLAVLSYAVFEKYFNDDSTQQFEPFTKGYALSGVTIQSTDETGKIVTTINSPAVTHYADSEKTVIQMPIIKLHEAAGDWVFTSDIGEINPQQTEIYFPNQVVIDLQGVEEESDEVNIVTEQLTVDVTKKSGTTPALLTMSQVDSVIKGLGAVVSFQQHEIHMLREMYAEFKD